MTQTAQQGIVLALPDPQTLQWVKIIWYLNRLNKRRWRNK